MDKTDYTEFENMIKRKEEMEIIPAEISRKISKNKVLLINLDPSITELAKRLILKGFHLYLYDPQMITEEDALSNYYLTQEDVGKNRSDVILEKLGKLTAIVSIIKINDFTEVKDDISVAVMGFTNFNDLCEYDDFFSRKGIFFYCVNTSGIFGFYYNNIGIDKNSKTYVTNINYYRRNDTFFNKIKKKNRLENEDECLLFAICLLELYYRKNIAKRDLEKEMAKDKTNPSEQYQKKIYFIENHLKLINFLNPLEDERFTNILEKFILNFKKNFSPVSITLGDLVCQQIYYLISKEELPKCKMFVYNSELKDFDYSSFVE
ncbi:MAG: hypothetical protein MJ252_11920 [archaeon]|nr:hypothetical protein [archaeon]